MITVENLTFGYTRKKKLYENFSLQVEPGRICGLLGKNGVGKSSLLYLLCGLLHPKSGRIVYKGANVFRRLPSQMSDLFLIPEEFDLPKTTLHTFVRANAGFYPRFSLEQLEYNLHVFGLGMDQNLGALSMGQKKKVYMSFALASGVSLLLMDEPTNGLDIPGKSQFRRLVAEHMNEERSFLISTHQVGDIDRMLDEVIILDEKGVLLNESVKTLCSSFLFAENIEEDEVAQAVYTQPTLNGLGGVLPNPGGGESPLNLELFFNAVLNHPDEMKQLLNQFNQKHDE